MSNAIAPSWPGAPPNEWDDESVMATTVLIAGIGLMGAQIAVEYALGGHDVVGLARRPAAAEERIARALELAGSKELAPADAVAAARGRLRVVGGLEQVAGEVALVVESVVEELAVKTDVLRACAARFPEATLASNTSSLRITALGAGAGAPERTIGTHYWNPPLLMPLVEVIRGDQTADATVDRVLATLRALGKRPVLVEQDVPGFVWNRLQLALLREAAWIVEAGVATPETVDEIVRDGLARRWRLTGPFETVALGGPATFTRIAANLFPVLSNATELVGIDRRLRQSPAELDALRRRRDDGLRRELLRDATPLEENGNA